MLSRIFDLVPSRGWSIGSAKPAYATDINGQPEIAGPFYKVYVTVKKYDFAQCAASDYRLVPGMSLIGDILVGKRTISVLHHGRRYAHRFRIDARALEPSTILTKIGILKFDQRNPQTCGYSLCVSSPQVLLV